MSKHPSPQDAHWPQGAIFTLGHSTSPIERFVAFLKTYGIQLLVDIRTAPRSRHNPQFNDTALAGSLTAEHFEYVHLRALGGLRHTRKESPNAGWRNESFRGYADYMQTEAFQDAIEALIQMSRQKHVALRVMLTKSHASSVRTVDGTTSRAEKTAERTILSSVWPVKYQWCPVPTMPPAK